MVASVQKGSGALRRTESEEQINFEQLVSAYETRLFRFALLASNDMALAENILCESFIMTFEAVNAGNVSDEASFVKHLFSTARVLVANLAKNNNTVGQMDVFGYRRTIFALNEYKLSRDGMLRAVINLPEHLRIVFVLKDINGFRRDLIADILGLSYEVVRERLHQARIQIRNTLCSVKRCSSGKKGCVSFRNRHAIAG